MPRNGSGQYNLPYDWNDDKANGIKVLASRMQTQDEDIGTALTGSVASDGQTPLTGDLDFNNNKAVDLADGSSLGDAINVSQAQTGETQFYGVSTTTPAGTNGEDYDIAPFATIVAYPTYARFSFICHFTCIVTPNARLNALAVKNLVKSNGASGYVALEAADMIADKEYIAVYNEDISTTEIIIENPELPIINPINITKATTSVYGVSYLPKQITIANNVSDANNDIDFSAGNFQFNNGSGQAAMSAKTGAIDALFGTGAGMLDTGTVANDTPYYLYTVYNPTTEDAKPLATATKGSPTMTLANAAGYTVLGSYIAGLMTDGSAHIRNGRWVFGAGGYEFFYGTIITESTNTVFTTTEKTATLEIPVNTIPFLTVPIRANGGAEAVVDINYYSNSAKWTTIIVAQGGGSAPMNFLQPYLFIPDRVLRYTCNVNFTAISARIENSGWKEYL